MHRRRRKDAASQPHDSLVKFAFSRREHAAGLLEAVLPPQLAEGVAWDTLVLENRSFISPALRSRHIDLLFSARLAGEPICFYYLIEQQRKVEPLMILRMGAYMWEAWHDLVKDQPALTRVPPIVPILIHHSETGWNAATSFPDIVAVPNPLRPLLARYTPAFEMAVVDMSPGQAARIAEGMLTGLGRMVLFCLSVADDDDALVAGMARVGGALDAMLAAGDGADALHAVLRYLLATHRQLSTPRVLDILQAAASDAQKKVIMDELDVFREEGRVEGRREGWIEGTAHALLRLLETRFGPVPDEIRARVLTAKEATLERWLPRVLTAPTLEAVLSGKAKKAGAGRRPPRKRARVG